MPAMIRYLDHWATTASNSVRSRPTKFIAAKNEAAPLSLSVALSTIQMTVRSCSVPPNFEEEHPGVATSPKELSDIEDSHSTDDANSTVTDLIMSSIDYRAKPKFQGKALGTAAAGSRSYVAVGSLVVRASDSRPEGLGSMPDATKYLPSTHGFHAEIVEVEICGVSIYRPFGELSRAKSYCHLYGAQDQRQAYF
ncbi:hypothetical protein TNCV_2026111 [Trichonephila clavipes]|nr:hypothetical protein TNCV_2026111 [Trichonephila clavipes]